MNGGPWRIAIITLIAGTLMAAILIAALPAGAHDAPSGWSYPLSCCSGHDCRPVSSAWIRETAAGFELPTGEVVPYSDARVNRSPDGAFHWCSVAGSDEGKTICLFVPDRMF